MPVYPQPNIEPNAAPWARSVNSRLDSLETIASRKAQDDINVNKQQNSSARVLAEQQAQLAEQLTQVAAVVATLQAAANVEYAEMGEAGNFSGFYSGSRPTINMTTPTGRLEVGYGGALNGGDGYIVYSVVNATTGAVYVDRNIVFGSPATRVAISGGASFAPSGYKNIVISVPANTPLTITLELYAPDTYVYFMGASLLVRAAL